MSPEPQRAVVIQEASRDVCRSAIKRVLKRLSLKPGDELTILAIFGNTIVKMDSTSFIATDQKILQQELGKIKEEYCKRPRAMKLYDYCKAKNINFQIEVLANPSPEVTCNAINIYRATYLVLNRSASISFPHPLFLQARPLLRERNYPDLIDERIMNSHDYHQLFWMVRIAEKCLSRDPQKRLNMGEVVVALTLIAEGEICENINTDFFPVRSDSFYSASDESEESSEDEIMNDAEDESESSDTDFSSNMSQMDLGLPNPPSPPLVTDGTSFSRLITVKEHDQPTMNTQVDGVIPMDIIAEMEA